MQWSDGWPSVSDYVGDLVALKGGTGGVVDSAAVVTWMSYELGIEAQSYRRQRPQPGALGRCDR